MKSLSFFLLLCAFLPASAEVYQCPKANGSSEYTAVFREGCTSANLEHINSYESNTSADTSTSSVSYSQPRSSGTATVNQKQKALDDAKKRLEEGQQQRLGNERNYAKYQERIRQLEEDVRKAEKNMR